MKYLRLVIFLGIVCLVNLVESRSSGAPREACGTLTPSEAQHGAPAQTSAIPYEVDLSTLSCGINSYCYVSGETYQRKLQTI